MRRENPIRYSFEADHLLEHINASSSLAQEFAETAGDIIASASEMGHKAGLPPVCEISASSPKARMFLYTAESNDSDVKLIGVVTDKEVTSEETLDLLRRGA